MVEQHKKALEKQLWNIANALRGNMSADEFRDYILGFVFYKYLSERMDLYADAVLKEDGIKFDAIDENSEQGKEYLNAIKEEAIDHLGYFLKPSELFHVLAKKGESGEFILEALTEVLNHIEQSTMGTAAEDDFNGLFDDLDLTSNKLGKTEKAKNELISKILIHLDDIDFLHDETEIDVLGDAYEYLIGQFASGAGKKAGEFYTPPMVSKLLAKLVTMGKDKLKSVYDPTCGSGSLLLRVAKEVKDVGGFYGQESNPSTYNLARMNMILHGIEAPNVIHTNTLAENLQDITPNRQHDIILANPPFGGKERPEVQQNFPIKTGETAFLFLQHFIKSLKPGGRAAIVIKNTFLSNTDNAAIALRKELLENCNLHTILDCPGGTFIGAGVKTVVLFFTKGEPTQSTWFYQLNVGRNMGKTNPLNDKDLADFVKLQASYADSDNSWSVASSELDNNTWDLSVKNPNIKEEAPLREPKAIIEEIIALDKESEAILASIQELL